MVQGYSSGILSLVNKNPYCTSRNLAKFLNCSKSIILRRLTELGYKNRWSTWIPRNLSPNHLQERQRMAELLLSHERRCSFIDLIITSDEKWIKCNNYGKKRACLQPNDYVQRPRVSRYGMKFRFCIFWKPSGVLYYELLQKGQTVTSGVYCRQLTKVAEKYRSFYGRTTKSCGPILLHDYARPHTPNQRKNAFPN